MVPEVYLQPSWRWVLYLFSDGNILQHYFIVVQLIYTKMNIEKFQVTNLKVTKSQGHMAAVKRLW